MFFIMGNNLGPFQQPFIFILESPEGPKQGVGAVRGEDKLLEWKCNYGSEYARDLCKPNDFVDARIFWG